MQPMGTYNLSYSFLGLLSSLSSFKVASPQGFCILADSFLIKSLLRSVHMQVVKSEDSIIAALLLCFFLGCFGAHRFYVGKWKTAILMFVTFGGLGIWALIDFIIIIAGKFTDKDGRNLTWE